MISIHVPREGDDLVVVDVHAGDEGISIHVPREGDDNWWTASPWNARRFQSTSPVRGTTMMTADPVSEVEISIHVPREGDDIADANYQAVTEHFNPRPP